MAKSKKGYSKYKIKDRSKKLNKRKNRMRVHGKDFGRMVRDAQAKRYRKPKGKTGKGGTRR